jgi:hypothetical protein
LVRSYNDSFTNSSICSGGIRSQFQRAILQPKREIKWIREFDFQIIVVKGGWQNVLRLHPLVQIAVAQARLAIAWGTAVANDVVADVSAVGTFWADSPKSLAGPPPEFGVAPFHRGGSYAWRANWPIADIGS